MRIIAFIFFGVGLVTVLGVGANVALHYGVPAQTDAYTEVASAGAPVAVPSQPRPQVMPPQLPDLPAGYIEISRPDLRPAAPADLEYTPEVSDVTTYRMIDGLSLRRASVYDGGQGPEPRPVVILFHGASRDELSMIDMWDETARTHGLILISLKSSGASWDPNTDDTGLIARALEEAEADFPIDRSRMFMFGHSAGAIYAQLLANRANGPWLAVAGHGGTLPVHWVQPQDAAVPMRHYLGSSDGLFAPFDARQSAEGLAEAGHHAELVLIPGHTHWFYEGGPAIAEDAWHWFADMMSEPVD